MRKTELPVAAIFPTTLPAAAFTPVDKIISPPTLPAYAFPAISAAPESAPIAVP